MFRETSSVLRLGAVTLVLLAGACSLLNRDGPDASCADLQNGATNACADGIIATCSSGTVSYKVCDEKSACSAPWQTSGRYRCKETEPAPILTASGGDGGPGGQIDGGPGSDGPGPNIDGSSTCTPPADEACSTQGRRYCTDGRTWTECLVENSNCVEHKSGGWSSFANTSGGACSGKPSGAVVSCKACEGSVICGPGGTNTCARPANAATIGCGKPGTVVKEPGTAAGQTYCLLGGGYMNRGAAAGTELGAEVSLCNPPYKPGDDVEACSGAGSAEVCYPGCATSYVRVCRTTGKWSTCHRGSL